jgi:hypothetical protein
LYAYYVAGASRGEVRVTDAFRDTVISKLSNSPSKAVIITVTGGADTMFSAV